MEVKKEYIYLFSVVIVISGIFIYNNNKMETYDKSKNICVLYVSGDIEPDFDDKYTENMKNLGKIKLVKYDPIDDASKFDNNNFNEIAKSIADKYNMYDSFVIISGDETLCYLASALSFMIENLSKPVILTNMNVYNSIKQASVTEIPEVMICDGDKLLRGCRTIPYSSNKFVSPNLEALTEQNSFKQNIDEPVEIKFMNPSVNVVLLELFPGIDDEYIKTILSNNSINGIVLQTYGAGKINLSDTMLHEIALAIEKGIVVLNISQCIEINEYQTDLRLLEIGVLQGYDLTVYAAFCKLNFLLANVEDKQMIGQLVDVNFRGEMSVDK